ncbi:AI-2E family transporter, partial [Xanthomonas oryzae pv. oryzicola]
MSLSVDSSDAAAAADSLPPAPAHRPRAPASMVVLATLAVGYTLWAAQTIILPIMLA